MRALSPILLFICSCGVADTGLLLRPPTISDGGIARDVTVYRDADLPPWPDGAVHYDGGARYDSGGWPDAMMPPDGGTMSDATLPILDAGPLGCDPGQTRSCYCQNGSQGEQVCRSDRTLGCCVCDDDPTDPEALACISQGVVGWWLGQAISPWIEPYFVLIGFFEDNHYSARCLSSGCVAFYYGTDQDSPLKTYRMVDVRADRSGLGDIVIVWDGSWQTGELSQIRLSPDENHLTFEFWNVWGGPRRGPIVYELMRSGY